MRKPLAAAVLQAALMTGARADENQYHCIVEQAAGLRYDNLTKAWVRSLLHRQEVPPSWTE
jgi:hypothetical protein